MTCISYNSQYCYYVALFWAILLDIHKDEQQCSQRRELRMLRKFSTKLYKQGQEMSTLRQHTTVVFKYPRSSHEGKELDVLCITLGQGKEQRVAAKARPNFLIFLFMKDLSETSYSVLGGLRKQYQVLCQEKKNVSPITICQKYPRKDRFNKTTAVKHTYTHVHTHIMNIYSSSKQGSKKRRKKCQHWDQEIRTLSKVKCMLCFYIKSLPNLRLSGIIVLHYMLCQYQFNSLPFWDTFARQWIPQQSTLRLLEFTWVKTTRGCFKHVCISVLCSFKPCRNFKTIIW